MKVSIITICFNSEKYLKDTIESVVQQTYADIEYIVVDGGSTDNSLQIVYSYKGKITQLISEKDNGLYDAINKGIKIASGEIIGLIHADDMLYSNDCISSIVNVFQHQKEIDVIYGDALCVNADNSSKIIRFWKGGDYDRNNFFKGWMPPHLATYIKRDIYEKYGYFNTGYKVAADYELLFRFLFKHNVRAFYFPKTMVRFRLGGVSNSSLKHILYANYEVYKSWKANGYNAPPLLIPLKLFSKLKQSFLKNIKIN